VATFAVAGLIATAVLGVAGAMILRRTANDEAIRQAKEVTRLAGEGIVEPAIDPGLFRGDRRALAALDRIVHARVLRDPVVRVKLWTAGGRVLYSDERRLIGSVYPLSDDDREALRSGRVDAELSDLRRPENRFERRSGKLLEVYLPIHSAGGPRMLFEAYSRFSAVEANRRRQLRALAPALVVALILLELLQVPLAFSLARRLRQRQQEREMLLRRTLEASDRERRRIAGALHEGVVQDLAGLGFTLSATAEAAGEASSAAALRSAGAQARQTLRKLRSALVEIYPASLRRTGLAAALQDIVSPLAAQGTEVDIRVPSGLALPPGGRGPAVPRRAGGSTERREARRRLVRHSRGPPRRPSRRNDRHGRRPRLRGRRAPERGALRPASA
jgi:two-component system NarL family sensor kinase